MKKFYFIIILAILSINLFSQTIYKFENIEVIAVKETDEFKDAKLKRFGLTSQPNPKEWKASFEVENYELKANSNNNLTGMCANSKDGQHIHIIDNNKPYTAIYTKEHNLKLDSGSHTILAFLSRSHHQSIKNAKAFQVVSINSKGEYVERKLKPLLFYSRPKGTYVGDDTKEILLDFYLVNLALSPKGYQVKIELDNSHTFYLSKWQPYIIKGLSMGDHTIKMSLIDKNKREVKNSLLPVERKFTFLENPPITK